MDNRSAPHGFIWHLFHRAGQHQPTEWERVRAQITPNAPAPKPQILINPTRLMGMARAMRTPQIKLPSLNTYLRQHGITLPEPVHQPAPPTPDRVPFDPTPQATLPPARFLQLSEPIVGLDALKTFASPEKTAQNEVAALPTWYPEAPQRHTDAIPRQTTGEFLLDDHRDTLFEDVPVSDVLDDDCAPTELHPRTKFKNAMSQLLGAEKGE